MKSKGGSVACHGIAHYGGYDEMNLTLEGRASEFQALFSTCESTDSTGGTFSPEDGILCSMKMLRDARERGSNLYLIGNGGSASIASHAVTDFVKVAKLRAQTLHDSSLITCMSNDYGYENAFATILLTVAKPNDILIAISSSGKSLNICNAVKKMRELGGIAVTLSGFSRENPLRLLGNFNIWVDSSDYGMVEIGHQFILHNLADKFGHENVIAGGKP